MGLTEILTQYGPAYGPALVPMLLLGYWVKTLSDKNKVLEEDIKALNQELKDKFKSDSEFWQRKAGDT